MVQIIEYTDFKLTPIQNRLHMVAGSNEGLPANTREVERNLIGQVVRLACWKCWIQWSASISD